MPSYDFIFGDAGSGKSRYIYQWLSREAELDPGRRFFLFVPEQNTLKAQREIIEHSSGHGMLNLDVLSFQLLFYRVIEELGIRNIRILDEKAGSLLIRKAALDSFCAGELKVYAGKLDSRGFIEQLKTIITEFYQYEIDPAKLMKASEAADEKLLKDKLADILSVYRRFTDLLGSGEVVPEEAPRILIKHIGQARLLDDAVIVFDGYTGFTPVQTELIKQIMGKARRVRFSVSISPDENYYRFVREDITDLWWLSKKTIADIIDAADEAGIKKSERTHICIRREGVPERNIHIIEASDPTDEIRRIAVRIKSDALFGGVRYKRMAVIVSDPGTYREIIKREFTAEDIPFFMDDKASAVGSPAVELFRSAFSMMSAGYRYDEVMRYLKNPLVAQGPAEREKTDEFDNELRKSGARGRKALIRVAGRCRDDFIKNNLDTVFAYHDALKAGETVEGMANRSLEFITDNRIPEKIEEFAVKLESGGFVKDAAENRRFITLLEELFEKTGEILGREKTDPEGFFRLMEAGFVDLKGGIIPETMDMVIIGDLKRSRVEDLHTLYIAGANDGLLPSEVTGGGILSDYERTRLEQIGRALPGGESFELAPDDRTDSAIQEFYLYSMMHKPDRDLIISYSRSGRDQRSLKPSEIVEELRERAKSLSDEEIIVSPQDALRKLAILAVGSGDRDGTDLSFDAGVIYQALTSIRKFRPRAEMIMKAAYSKFKNKRLSPEAAELLYGRRLNSSVSRLESFAKCPYGHFLRYGLELKEREEFDIEALDLGNLYHEALDEVFKSIGRDGKKITDVTDGELDKAAGDAVDLAVAEYKEGRLTLTAKNIFIADRLKRTVRKTLRVLRDQLIQGSFDTLGTEIVFSRHDDLLGLSGKIDRVDYAGSPETGRTYVKIIDYKSGNNSFDLPLAVAGVQMQLTVYMGIALDEVRKRCGVSRTVPGGMFYYHIDDPVINYDKLAGADPDKLKLEALRLKGVILNDPELVRLIDKELDVSDTDKVDKKTFKTSGVVAGPPQSLALNEEEFGNLMAIINENVNSFAKEILGGNIDIRPYRYKKKTGCDYCGYRSICGFDHRVAGYRYRWIKEDSDVSGGRDTDRE